MRDPRLETYRLEDMRTLGFWVVSPICALLVLQSYQVDVSLYSSVWSRTWLWLRLGVIPSSMISGWIIKRARSFNPDFGAILAGIYVAGIHAYFVTQTGFEQSKYTNAYVQLLLGIAILPLKPVMFGVAATLFLALYVGAVSSGGGADLSFLHQGDAVFLWTYVCMSALLYYVVWRARQSAYRARAALEDEIASRDQKIATLVAEQIELKQKEAMVDLASQVAHDIRAPLAALDMVFET